MLAILRSKPRYGIILYYLLYMSIKKNTPVFRSVERQPKRSVMALRIVLYISVQLLGIAPA